MGRFSPGSATARRACSPRFGCATVARMKLHGFAMSPNTKRAMLGLEEAGLVYEGAKAFVTPNATIGRSSLALPTKPVCRFPYRPVSDGAARPSCEGVGLAARVERCDRSGTRTFRADGLWGARSDGVAFSMEGGATLVGLAYSICQGSGTKADTVAGTTRNFDCRRGALDSTLEV